MTGIGNKKKSGDQKLKYLIHLWKVNSPHYGREECLKIVADRAGYSFSGARKALRKAKLYKD